MRSRRSGAPAPEPLVEGSGRIRVLWLIKGLGRGGAEMLLYEAARLRDGDAFDGRVGYVLGSRSWLAEDLEAQGVPVYLFGAERHGDLRWGLKLRRHLKADPVDIVHVHSPLVAAVARLACRSLPRSVRPRTISTEHLPWTGHRLPTKLVNRATFRLDAAHLAVSDAVVESIPRRLRSNVRVLIHGVPVDVIRAHLPRREQARAEIGVSQDEILVATVANATPQKGYPDLMAAARIVLDRGHRVRFAIVGRGTQDAGMVATRDRLGLADHVMLLGPLEDVPRFLAGADIFALASHWEGLPLAIMEALAAGIPTVATDVGGVPELVRDGVDGVLVPHARPEQFAGAIERLILDPVLRSRMGNDAAAGASRFDNLGAVRAIEALYREVLGRPREEAVKGRKPIARRSRRAATSTNNRREG